MNNPLTRFKWVAFLEGTSFLILLFVCVPLKYGLGILSAKQNHGYGTRRVNRALCIHADRFQYQLPDWRPSRGSILHRFPTAFWHLLR